MDDYTTQITPKENRSSHATQYFVTLAATLGTVAAGSVVGYTSPALPRLIEPESSVDGSLRLTQDQANWFSSSINLAAAIGALVGGYAINKLGRKPAILLHCIVYVIGWILVAAATNFAMLMVGRLITGLCLGATCVMVPTYIGEIASPDIRGFLASGFQVMGATGNVWGYGLGALISSWRWLAIAMAAPAILCFLLILFAKESPLYLLLKSKDTLANSSLQFFRGKDYNCALEMEAMHQFLEESKHNKASAKDLLKPYNLKPFIICLFIFIFTQCAGITPVVFNLYTIFQDAGTGISENMSSIIVGVVQVLATIVSAFLMDRAGRKLLLIASTVFTTLSLAALGDYFYFKNQDSEWARETLGWLPLTCLIVYITAINVGFITVQWVMLGELFAPEVREVAGSIATLPAWILAFIFAITFVPMQDAIGAHGVYWVFGGMSVLALIFSVVFVPETKGKTMQEISEYFGGPSSKDNTRE